MSFPTLGNQDLLWVASASPPTVEKKGPGPFPTDFSSLLFLKTHSCVTILFSKSNLRLHFSGPLFHTFSLPESFKTCCRAFLPEPAISCKYSTLLPESFQRSGAAITQKLAACNLENRLKTHLKSIVTIPGEPSWNFTAVILKALGTSLEYALRMPRKHAIGI